MKRGTEVRWREPDSHEELEGMILRRAKDRKSCFVALLGRKDVPIPGCWNAYSGYLVVDTDLLVPK